MKRIALVVLALAAGAAGAIDPIRIISLPTRLSALEGVEVRQLAGEQHLGRVADLTVDLANGRVRYAVLETPRGARPVPLYAFTPALDGKALLLDATRERLAQAPERPGGPEAYWSSPRAPRIVPASTLLGRAVRGPDGRRAGTLADVVLDAHDGNILFAVLALAPGRLHPVPLREHDLGAGELADAGAVEKAAAYAERLAPL